MKQLQVAVVIVAALMYASVASPKTPRNSVRSETVPMLLTVGSELRAGAFVDLTVPRSMRKGEFVTGVCWFPDIDKPDAHSRANLVHLQHVTVNVGQDQVVHLGILTASGAPTSTKIRIVVEIRSLLANE
jgi:hypothetical protein